jgi:hypothetical protein
LLRGVDDTLDELLLVEGAAAGFDSVLELEPEFFTASELVPNGTRTAGADSTERRSGREVVVVVLLVEAELFTGRALLGAV